MKKRRVATRTEMWEVWWAFDPPAGQVYCEVCANRQSPLLAPQEVATLTSISWRTIFRRVEAGPVHFKELHGGSLLFCLNSLPGDLDVTLVRPLLPSA